MRKKEIKTMADKMTKKDWFDVIRDIVEDSESDQKDGAIEFIDKQVELLAAKAAKAQERAAAKKVEGDDLRAAVLAVITAEAQTVDEIVAQIEDPDATRQKVVARLTQLVKAGEIEKDMAKVDGKKVTTYKIA
jgi:hypothetical protein